MNKNAPKVVLMDIDKIKPYDKNAKIHTQSQIESLAKVIKSQGWDVPIVVDREGVVIKGHGRRLAALHLGMAQVPVIVRDDLTDAQVKAARLSDNRVAMGDFDVDAIKDELATLKSDGFDLSNMGFDDKEVTMMLGDLDKLDFAAFEGETISGNAPEASVSASPIESVDDATDTPDATVERPVQLGDVLGFKAIPAKYKDALVVFLASAQEEYSDDDAATAFGKAIAALVGENEDHGQ
jgi:hypothetical protein